MPPKGDALSLEQIALLRAWVDQGAPWPESSKPESNPRAHWAYQPLVKPMVPPVGNRKWVRNEIDAFVLAKLEQQKMVPSPEADRVTLIRRLTYDLQGLPPTPEEVEEFVADKAADAYERLVERLLASPRYGERWARHWLDVVHYGETHGYDKDKRRPNAWPYRDYVVRAFNQDKPYSRFVQEQLAGDVLFPDDADSIVALGFIAAGPWDFVGHVELPESKSDGLVARYNDRDDMLTTTMQTFCSTTANCARCHNHKFDPIPQTDYYRLQAVFAGIDRAERPFEPSRAVALRRKELTQQLDEVSQKLAAIDARIRERGGEDLAVIDKRIKELGQQAPKGERPEFGYHSAIAGSPNVMKWVQVDLGETVELDHVVLVGCHDDFNNIGAGFGFPVRFKIEGSNDPKFQQDVALLADQTTADFLNPRCTPQVFAARGQRARYLRVTATWLALRQNDYIFALAELMALTQDGRNVAAGKPVEALDSIEAPVRWSKKNLTDGYYFGVGNQADPTEPGRLSEKRQQILARIVTPELLAERETLETGRKEVERALAALPPPQMVYAATSKFKSDGNFAPTGGKPRPIFLLNRGDVKQPREPMGAGALSLFPELEPHFQLANPNDEGARRAALARWITDGRNSLARRSIVNRVWQNHFGRGIVDTPNDFGKMGAAPTHPELLDWLSVWFAEQGESFKKLHQLIVTSAAYRQSSRDQPHFARIDSDNRYLWRADRQRLDAECVRDAVLLISGQLDLTVGGPSVDHFAFEDDHSPRYLYAKFDVDSPAARRRSLYRTIVRSVPDPFMDSMDCPDANLLTPKRNTTLTALQALAMLNDRLIIHAAERLAMRVGGAGDLAAQITAAYRLALSRSPRPDELKLLTDYARKNGLANTCRLLFNSNEFIFVD